MIVNKANLAGVYTGLSTLFNQTLKTTPVLWDRVATLVPSESSENDYKWLGKIPALREWLGDRIIKSLEAHKYVVINKKYEGTLAVAVDDIEDDKIGVYRPVVQGMAERAATHPDKLVFDLLKAGFETDCFDGQFFFDEDHPVAGGEVSNDGGGAGNPWFLLDVSKFIKPLLNQERQKPIFASLDEPTASNVFMRDEFLYGVKRRGNAGFTLWQLAYGSKETLDATNYAAYRAAMMAFTDDEGEPLDITPNLLVCGPANEGAARELLLSERTDAGKTNKWRNTAELLVVARVET